MQKLKIYGQKKQDGSLYHYTYLTRKEKKQDGTEKTYFKKLIVGFMRDKETLGNITVKESTLTFSNTKFEMDLINKINKQRVKCDVPYISYKLIIWDYEKTIEDIEKDEKMKLENKTLIKEYVSEEQKAQFREQKQQRYNNTNTEQQNGFKNDLEDISLDEELPF